MPASQEHITQDTPMGANLVPGGATFRVFAPSARTVYINGIFDGTNAFSKDTDEALLLVEKNNYWAGFIPNVKDGDQYLFFVDGKGFKDFKRDPYARELSTPANFPGSSFFPSCNCVVRDPHRYQWHDQNFHPPAFNDLVIYQLHIGTFFGPQRAQGKAKFLDVLDKIDHLVQLGINAVEPLPVDEVEAGPSQGYNSGDYFSPDPAFGVDSTDPAFGEYFVKVNNLLTARGKPPINEADITGSMAQLKVMIDVFHVYGIAVIFDVVYNHAGPFNGDGHGLYFFDLVANPNSSDKNNNDSLYFTDQSVAGGLVFAYFNQDVRQFLISNAIYWMQEFHVDGFRYDLASEIENHGGTGFCQDLTDTVRFVRSSAPQIAEYWNDDRKRAVEAPPNGLGFDMAWHDLLRDKLRGIIGDASAGGSGPLDMQGLAGALAFHPTGFPNFFKAVQFLESHDDVHVGAKPRIPALADSTDHRSFFSRSRARVATGILLTAPCVPMLFMGEEFLEDKQWTDNPQGSTDNLIFFDGLDPHTGDKRMQDFYRFTQELVRLRLRHPALRGETVNAYHAINTNRILAYHRWLDGFGRDVVIVVSLNEFTFNQPNYRLGFPQGGLWLEVFNSDVFEDFGNRQPHGNGGSILVDGPAMDGFSTSAGIVVPANGILVFAKDRGD
jgi:1,4-alpha-glucan branching enzyme